MQIPQLEAFVQVSKQGTVLRAAEGLRMSQPAVTLRIKALERALGTRLLVRGPHGMLLTDAGRSLLPYAERVLSLLEDATSSVRDAAGGGVGTLFVAASPAATACLPTIVSRFHVIHPRVVVHIRRGGGPELRDMILREHVQIGLGRLIADPRIEATPLYEDELVVISGPRGPLASRKRVTPKALAQTMIIWPANSYVDDLFREAGVALQQTTNVDDPDLQKRMIESGQGVGLEPLSLVWDEVDRGALHAAQLVGARSHRIRQGMIMAAMRRAGAPASPILGSFLEIATAFVPPGAHAIRTSS